MEEQGVPIVFIVDDDPSMRSALRNLIQSVGFRVEVFSSAQEFLGHKRAMTPACLVLDVRLKGMSGLELQRELAAANDPIPVIFITGHGDIPMTVRAMKAGAIEFLMKPFQKEDLLAAIHQGLERDRIWREEHAQISSLRDRFEQLSSREREVMDLVVSGLINKQIGAQLGLSEVTVKIHRGRVMQKMQAASLADLVRMSDKLKPRARR